MSDLKERRVPVLQYLYKPDDHSPLDREGLKWLADQLCSETRVHPDRTMSTGWMPYQAAYEFPHMMDRIEQLEAALLWYAEQMCEGWCDKDPQACASIGPDNCAGCPARQALGDTQ